jgi:hypothetical protein
VGREPVRIRVADAPAGSGRFRELISGTDVRAEETPEGACVTLAPPAGRIAVLAET